MSAIISGVHQVGSGCSGKPCSAVQIAFAWISAPDIRSWPVTEVGWTSPRVGAAGPITTVRPLNVPVRKLPSWTSEYEEVGIVPGPPR